MTAAKLKEKQPDLFKVDGSYGKPVPYEGTQHDLSAYAVWRVVRIDTGHLICAFFGGASGLAATEFCNRINADPEWRRHVESELK